jgi:hypothetical protein
METLLEKSKKYISRNQTINFGYANSWNKEIVALYDQLKEHAIPESSRSENVGRCLNDYFFDVNLEGNTYVVKYRVDSSD